MSFASVLLVAFGGAIGSTIRWALSECARAGGVSTKWALFLINVLGSLAFGVLVGRFAGDTQHDPRMSHFWLSGVLGGFTTFSAFSGVLLEGFAAGRHVSTLVYSILQVSFSFVAASIGLSWTDSAIRL